MRALLIPAIVRSSLAFLVVLACLVLTAGCERPGDGEAGKREASDKKAQDLKTPSVPVAPVPRGLPPVPVPADNPMTPEKIELGKLLYFDKRLSKDGTISCATCHDPKIAWAEDTPTSEGISKQKGGRNSPTVINSAYMKVLFWDGRAKSLEEQAVGPVGNPIEMGHSMIEVVKDLNTIPEYKQRFKQVFGTDVTEDGIAKAIATFERTVLSGDSPYDRHVEGDQSALTDAQKRGWEVFQNAGCNTCHAPPTFSNSQFYNAGISSDKPGADEGLKKITGKDADLGKFRVPALREIASTAPYFHDGSTAKLEDAVELMASGGKENPNLSSIFVGVREAKLTAENKKDLLEFLKALSGTYPQTEPPRLP